MDERNKRASGITMVALAVTIVVLLILASVTIGTLFGENGLINNVRNRKNNAYQKLVNEEVKQITTEYDIANSGETLEEFLEEKVKEGRVDEVTRKDDKTLEVKKDGYTVEVESENRDFSLIVEAYIGTYDEKTHDIISNLEVKPTDAKIEYSTDNGKTYSATMPTITNASSVQVTVRASRIGYKTETVTKTAIVNKAEGKVTLSATSGTITYPDSTTFMVSGNTGNLSVSSNSTNIATASISGSTVTVKPGTTAGKATITVTSAAATNYNAKSATYTATVNNGTITLSATPYTGTYDGKAHNAITSVTVNPSDAKIEYSTDGTNYSTTMPTVTNSSSFTVTVRASKAGYKTQTTTQTVKVNKAAGTLTLSATSGTSENSKNLTFTVSGNTGTLSVTSSNTNVATVSISGNTVTVKPTGIGKATITVTSAATTNYNAKSATYTATVKNPVFNENSGVGYYADIDNDGTVDGVIFEDFKFGGNGSWGTGDYGTYKIPTVSNTKSYYISQNNYEGPFGIKNVLVPNGSGNARFYVMALNDYNDKTYGFRSAQRITISGNWVIPSINELSAFGGELGITSSNYTKYGLKYRYCSSSWDNTSRGAGCYISFSEGKTDYTFGTQKYYIRLAIKF